MGQRLVITLCSGEQKLAAAYYHWSAYTEPSYELAEQLIQALRVPTEITDKKLYAIRLLELTGAGLEDEIEEKAANELFPGETFNHSVDRNDGLIAITPETISDTIGAGEYFFEIDITTKRIKFEVWSIFDKDGYKECYDDDPDLKRVTTLELPAQKKIKRTLTNWLDIDDFLELYSQADMHHGKYYSEIIGLDGKKYKGVVTAIY